MGPMGQGNMGQPMPPPMGMPEPLQMGGPDGSAPGFDNGMGGMGGTGFSPEGQAPGGPGFSPEGQAPPIAGVPVEPRPARYTGLVKTFDDVKGWGHIECEASRQVYGKDIFLLRSACNGLPVTANNQLEFAVIMSPKGPQ